MIIKDAAATRNSVNTAEKPATRQNAGFGFFAARLEQQQTEFLSYEQEVDDLRKKIEEVGDKLDKEPSLENYKQFREILSKLAKRVSSEAYRLEKIGGTPQNPRYYETINIINAEADKLYRLIISENRDKMAITAKVIGIKGLVVDLIT